MKHGRLPKLPLAVFLLFTVLGSMLAFSPPTALASSSISLSPPFGPVGTDVILGGAGLVANQSLTVAFDGNGTGMPTACTTDGSGSINAGCTLTVPPSAPGNHTVTVSDGTNSPTAIFTVIILPALSAGAITPSAPATDSGQSVTLTANPSGGMVPYSYQWYASSDCQINQISGATSSTYSASPASTTTYYYDVTDSNLPPVSVCSAGDTVTVNSVLSAGAITPSAPAIDSGQSVTLTANPSGGTAPYAYQWYTSSDCRTSPISGATSSTYSASPTSTTTYYYGVTDSSSAAASACSSGDTVAVSPGLSAPGITASSNAIDINQSVMLSDTAPLSGGTPTYTCQWLEESPSATGFSDLGSSFGPSGGCTATGTPSISTGALAAAGAWAFELEVSDGSSHPEIVASASATVAVNPALSAGAITPPGWSFASGQSVTLTANPSGGTAPYAYQWYTSSDCRTSPISGATSSTYSASPVSTTTYYYGVIDTSSPPVSVCSAGATVMVNLSLSAGAIAPNSPTVGTGESIRLSANPSGGVSPYSITWYTAAGAGVCTTSDSPVSTGPTYSPSPKASTYYCYIATDSESKPVSVNSSTDLVTVGPALSPPTISVLPKSIGIGHSAHLSTAASFAGGAPSYTCQWLEKSPSATGFSDLGSSFTTPCTTSSSPSTSTGVLSTAGKWSFELQVTDSAGTPVTVTSNAVTVTVNLPLDAPVISVSQASILKGSTATLSTTAPFTGGTAPYTCRWLKKSPTSATYVAIGSPFATGCTPTSKPSVSTGVLTATGTWSFELKVTDETGAVAVSSLVKLSVGLFIVQCSPASATVGSATTCRATAYGLGSTPVGSVTWSSSGSGKLSSTTCSLFNSVCSVKYTPKFASSPSVITARYYVASKHSPSIGTFSLTVTKMVPKVTVSCTPNSVPATSSVDVVCKAKVTGYSPTGTVNWSQKGTGSVSLVVAACRLSGGSCSATVTGASPGTVTIVPTYSGDSNNQGGSGSATLTITTAPPPPWKTCGGVITTSTTMTASIGPCPKYGLVIGKNGITLNCNGHTITGKGIDAGIALIMRTKVTVENCNVTRFQYGILLTNSSSDTFTSNTANGNKQYGFYVLRSSHNTFTGDTASSGNYEAFLFFGSSHNVVTGNTADGNNFGFYFFSSPRNTLTRNVANYNTYDGFCFDVASGSNTLASNRASNNTVNGFEFDMSSNDTLTSNTANGNDFGFYLFTSSHDTLTSNTANSNKQYGFTLDFSSYDNLIGNTANGNHYYGFRLNFLSSGNTLTGNTADSNAIYGYDDYSIGSGTMRTANTYHNDECSGNLLRGSLPGGLGSPQN